MANRKINLYFVRHAESVSNASLGKDSEHDDTCSNGLTKIGIDQAYRLGQHFADSEVRFSRVYSSDYLRAVETAKYILEKFEGVDGHQPEIEISKKLRDLDFGSLEHASYAVKTAHYMASNGPLQDWTLPEGESFSGAGHRVLKFIENICTHLLDFDEIPEHEISILITTHSLAIASFLHFLSYQNDLHRHSILNWDPKCDIKVINNCCYYKFQVSRKKLQTRNTLMDPAALNFEALEKYASGHLKINGEVEKKKPSEDKIKLVNVLKSSGKGREILNCCQQ